MIYKVRDFVQRRIEPEIFVSILAVFMSPSDFHPHEDLVRMDLSYSALFHACIDANTIADLQHFPVPLS